MTIAEYDVRIAGGEVFVGGEVIPADLYVRNEKIALLVDRRLQAEAFPAAQNINAAGMTVLPGAIDTHTHTRDPGYTHKEDFLTASQAAASGGVTSIVDMPNVEPPTDTLETFEEKRAVADAKCIVDWGHWVAGTKPEQIPKLAAAGATGFKIFQVSGAYPHDPRLAMNDEAALMASFRAIAETGLPCLVHPFNQSLFERLSEEAFAAGKPPNGRTFSEVYTTEAIWHTAVNTLINLQELTDVRLQLLHTHSAGSLRLIRNAKERGRRVTAEVDPKYYHYTLDDLERMGARAVPAGFVTEDEERMAEIWRSLNDGTIDNISTDHAPHTLDEIAVADQNAWEANLGSPQLEWLYSLILTDVSEGRHSLARAVALLCENPAKLIGVWPAKGALLPGSDADLVLVDLDEEFEVTEKDIYTKVGWTAYEGRRLKGKITLTMLRGQVIATEGKVIGEPGYGRYLGSHPQ